MSDRSEGSAQRRARLGLLRRQRAGDPARIRLRQLLAGAPPDTWCLLSLDESDALGAKLFSAAGAARQNDRLATIPGLSRVEFTDEIHRLVLSRPHDQPVLVALSNPEELGLLEVRPPVLAAVAQELLDFDRDSLIVAAPDLTWGIISQRFEYDADVVSYQIEFW